MRRARKRFGQHFLEPAWQMKVVDACAPSPDDAVIEIGPGHGAITDRLAPRVGRLLAIEIDRDLAQSLEAGRLPGVTVHTGDVLDDRTGDAVAVWLDAGPSDRLRVVGNLPYNVSTPILFLLGRWAGRFPALTDATLMLQAEVAARLTARAGTGEYGVLTILTALVAEVTPLFDLPPGAFRPVPRVRSSLVRLRFRPPEPPVAHPALVSRLVRATFTQRRKTLANGLKAIGASDRVEVGQVLAAAGLDGQRRPETLQLVEFSALADAWDAATVL